jgi:uncharacterized protein
MTLEAKVAAGLKSAMIARDSGRVAALRMLKAAFGYAQIERKTDALPDNDAMEVLRREVKKRKDAIEQLEQGGRAEQAAAERTELVFLEEFLPVQLSPVEVEELVKAAIAETGAISKRDLGRVMQTAVAKAAGRADGRAISAVAGRLLP